MEGPDDEVLAEAVAEEVVRPARHKDEALFHIGRDHRIEARRSDQGEVLPEECARLGVISLRHELVTKMAGAADNHALAIGNQSGRTTGRGGRPRSREGLDREPQLRSGSD